MSSMKEQQQEDEASVTTPREQPLLPASSSSSSSKNEVEEVFDEEEPKKAKKAMDAPGYIAGSSTMQLEQQEEEEEPSHEVTLHDKDENNNDDEEQASDNNNNNNNNNKTNDSSPKQQHQYCKQQHQYCSPCCIGNRLLRCQCCCFILVIAFVIFLAVIMIGSVVESNTYSRADSTINLYPKNGSVCGMYNNGTDNDDDDNVVVETFPNAQAALEASNKNTTTTTTTTNFEIVHCGDCGDCSNTIDLEIYAATRNSLTGTATTCALRSFIGRSHVYNCLDHHVGFTPSCNDCWTNNIACTFQHCKFTCLKYKIFGQSNNNGNNDGNHDGGTTKLNDCLQCDEVSCGEAFLTCSGSNRRRMGVISDIGRDETLEQCKDVTVDWAARIPAE